MTRRFVSATAAVALVLASCGGSDAADETPDTAAAVSDADDTAEPEEDFTETDDTAAPEPEPEEELEPEEVPEPAVTDAASEEQPDPEAGDSPVAGAIAASLVEWAIEAPTEYAAGDVTFTASNDGDFPHELVVIQGEGYESLPREESGAVLEDELPTGALIGRTARIGGGASEDLTVTLAPGNYVLVCNLGAGAASHAGQGQRLDITVS